MLKLTRHSLSICCHQCSPKRRLLVDCQWLFLRHWGTDKQTHASILAMHWFLQSQQMEVAWHHCCLCCDQMHRGSLISSNCWSSTHAALTISPAPALIFAKWEAPWRRTGPLCKLSWGVDVHVGCAFLCCCIQHKSFCAGSLLVWHQQSVPLQWDIHRKWQYQFWCCQQTLHCSVYCRAAPKLSCAQADNLVCSLCASALCSHTKIFQSVVSRTQTSELGQCLSTSEQSETLFWPVWSFLTQFVQLLVGIAMGLDALHCTHSVPQVGDFLQKQPQKLH